MEGTTWGGLHVFWKQPLPRHIQWMSTGPFRFRDGAAAESIFTWNIKYLTACCDALKREPVMFFFLSFNALKKKKIWSHRKYDLKDAVLPFSGQVSLFVLNSCSIPNVFQGKNNSWEGNASISFYGERVGIWTGFFVEVNVDVMVQKKLLGGPSQCLSTGHHVQLISSSGVMLFYGSVIHLLCRCSFFFCPCCCLSKWSQQSAFCS